MSEEQEKIKADLENAEDDIELIDLDVSKKKKKKKVKKAKTEAAAGSDAADNNEGKFSQD
jgi:hypothetical protein